MLILLGNRQATFPEIVLSLCRDLYCVHRIAMLLLVGLVDGGGDGDGVDAGGTYSVKSCYCLLIAYLRREPWQPITNNVSPLEYTLQAVKAVDAPIKPLLRNKAYM